MKITSDLVRHVARLSRLELSEAELETFTHQLDAIVGYVAQLEQVDTSRVEGTAHAVDLTCPTRPDTPRPGLERQQVLDPAPEHDGEHFLVPRVLDTRADGAKGAP